MSRLPADSLAYSLQLAARVLAQVMAGRSLAEGLLEQVPKGSRPAVQDMVYGALRAYGHGSEVLAQLMARKPDDPELEALLLTGLARLESRPESAFVTVDQLVEAAGELARGKYRGLCNGVLRNYLRKQKTLQDQAQESEVARYRHPLWWIRRLQAAYPNQWEEVLAAGNSHPPMALRVNRRQVSVESYLEHLQVAGISAEAGPSQVIHLKQALPVAKLPHFADGWVSVQDPGAQRAAEILAPQAGDRLLDACAAPGGKAAHLLEWADVELSALDVSPQRCKRISENFARLKLEGKVLTGDARRPSTWWDGKTFDGILADVPCSASGVVRRHPDAKWLRRDTDVAGFTGTQADILKALWPCLKAGAKLLYATCSVFPEENQQQIAKFLARHPDARQTHEEQLLPCADHDGFYYALLRKLD